MVIPYCMRRLYDYTIWHKVSWRLSKITRNTVLYIGWHHKIYGVKSVGWHHTIYNVGWVCRHRMMYNVKLAEPHRIIYDVMIMGQDLLTYGASLCCHHPSYGFAVCCCTYELITWGGMKYHEVMSMSYCMFESSLMCIFGDNLNKTIDLVHRSNK